jgi:hypothetical protein
MTWSKKKMTLYRKHSADFLQKNNIDGHTVFELLNSVELLILNSLLINGLNLKRYFLPFPFSGFISMIVTGRILPVSRGLWNKWEQNSMNGLRWMLLFHWREGKQVLVKLIRAQFIKAKAKSV